MTRWNRLAGLRLAVPALACAAALAAGCAHSVSASASLPAREADAMTAPGSHAATDNPTLTADEIGRRFLELIGGLESRDQLSVDSIREVMGIAIPLEPGELLAGVGSPDLGGGWRYVLNYVSESPSNARGVALSFVNEREDWADMAGVCGLDFDHYHNALVAMGYRDVAIPGEIGELRSVRYHKGDLTFSIIPRYANSGSGRLCVESIGTLN
jgi:hypothetical protein